MHSASLTPNASYLGYASIGYVMFSSSTDTWRKEVDIIISAFIKLDCVCIFSLLKYFY